MKKKLILLPLLLFLFMLTGCSLSNEKMNFEIDEDVMASETRQYILNLHDMSDTEYEFCINAGSDFEKSAAKGFRQADTTDHVGKYVGFKDLRAEYKNGPDGQVVCSVICDYTDRDVTVSISYEKNYQFDVEYTTLYETLYDQSVSMGYASIADYMVDYNYYMGTNYPTDSLESFTKGALISDGSYPYKPVECEVSANYTKAELLKSAGRNTLIGMVTVFAVLIFISFIISLLKFVPRLLGQGEKKEKKEKKADRKAAPAPARIEPDSLPAKSAAKEEEPTVHIPVGASDTLMQDAELVAVIMAAIRAAEGEGATRAPACTASSDTLVVRSIRRVR